MLSTARARPKLSPDGTKVAYSTSATPQTWTTGSLFLMDASGGEATNLLDGGITIYGWTADGNQIVYWDGTPIRFSVFDLRDTQDIRANLSPNVCHSRRRVVAGWQLGGLLLAASGQRAGKLGPVRDGKAAAEAEWITVSTTAGANRRPWWSPDGNLLYFLSTRDNYQCIWAQHLDPVTKRPRGEP